MRYRADRPDAFELREMERQKDEERKAKNN